MSLYHKMLVTFTWYETLTFSLFWWYYGKCIVGFYMVTSKFYPAWFSAMVKILKMTSKCYSKQTQNVHQFIWPLEYDWFAVLKHTLHFFVIISVNSLLLCFFCAFIFVFSSYEYRILHTGSWGWFWLRKSYIGCLREENESIGSVMWV